ncbi:hypothetical protein MBLNU459_g7856t1 [Dothideomycetes sp. NU459]
MSSEEPLKVIVIGAGLGGCACALALHHQGFDVTVYEKLRSFRRLGDSLGLGENALKLLRRWGGDNLYTTLTKIGNQAPDMQIRRWNDGKILAQQPLMDMVVTFDETIPSVIFANGKEERADLVVGADGIKSRARELVLGFADKPKSSGYSCYRAYFPSEHLREDPLCRDFVDHDCVNIWIGEDTHLVQNTLRDGKEFNWILTRKLSHEADLEIEESWFQDGDMEDVRKLIESCDPRIAAAVKKTPSCLDWKICYRDPIPTWVSKSHKVVLLGDSCHPHLPTSAQGASQATESAAVLAVCLKLAGKQNVKLATRTYEKLRFDRVRSSQTNGEDVRDRWHSALKDVNDANNGTLNTNGVIFWPGTSVGWEGIITVDGTSYEYLGTGSQSLPSLKNLRPAVPLSVSYDASHSNFTFAAGPVHVTASFLSPVLPQDLCRTSIPLSYWQTSYESTDGGTHDVQLYSDVNAAWISYESNKTILWNLFEGNTVVNGSGNITRDSSLVYSWIFELEQQYEFAEESDFPSWGNFTYSSSLGQAQNFSFESGFSATLRYGFVMDHGLSDIVDANYRASGSMEPVFAYAHDFGSSTKGSALYTIGSVQQPIIRYLTSEGLLPLQPWWTKCYGDIFQMINFHYEDFETSQAKSASFDAQLRADVDRYYNANPAVYSNSTPSPPPYYSNGSQGYADGTDQFGQQYIFDPNTAYGFLDPNNFSGIAIPDVSEAESYYGIVALSTRQIMGAYVLTVPPSLSCDNSSTNNQSEPLMFQKEISSDGNVNTVDVMYPAMPFFLYANPELLKYNLNPLFYNQEGGFYPNGYSMHDLGSNFPNATGHVEGNDEYMPTEESGNMLLMTLSYAKFSGNAEYLRQHYAKLQQWASYLIQFSLVPGIQLSTDDFAGQLINQTNLAIKGIVGLQAMSQVATIVGDTAAAANYSSTASSYYKQWEYFAIDPSERHTMLAYEWRSSYGLLYNTYPDKLLDLGIIPQSLHDMQSSWYATVSQVFGVPLDSRHSYTKSDWQLWTAATCAPQTRRLLVDAVAAWLNATATDRAFSDLYETVGRGTYPVSPSPVYFVARPVVGGHFSLLALLRAGENGDDGTGAVGSVFAANSTAGAVRESLAAYMTVGAGTADASSVSAMTGTSGFSNGSATASTEAATSVGSTVNGGRAQTTA